MPFSSLPSLARPANMRFIFSTTDHTNTDISDDQGCIKYTISTPPTFKKVTTITKYDKSGAPETMGVIEWHWLKQTLFRFDGKVIPADEMLEKRTWSNGRYFVGPDQQTYKWKVEACCWMKPVDSNRQLVRFHEKNIGFFRGTRPAYLDVSDKVVTMLDYIVLTFVYVESLRIDQSTGEKRSQNREDPLPNAGAMAAAGF